MAVPVAFRMVEERRGTSVSRRLFAAVRPPDDVVAQIDAEVGAGLADLGRNARLVPPEAWHVTLAFYAKVEDDDLDRLRLSLAMAGGRVEPFVFEFAGLGAFPVARRARVVWVGVADGAGRLAELATTIEAESAKRGFPGEDREFSAHMTVARLREPADVSGPVAVLGQAASAGPVEVREIVLYESRTHRSGATYDVVDTFPLRT